MCFLISFLIIADKSFLLIDTSVNIDKYVSIYAWQLRDVTRLSVQRPFKHPLGAITWVRLRASEANTAEVSEANGAAEASRPNPLTIRTCNSAEGCGRCFCETCYPLG